MSIRMIAAGAISCAIHAVLAFLISSASMADSVVLRVPSVSIHVRLMSAQRVHVEREVSMATEPATAAAIELSARAAGGTESPLASDSSGSVLPGEPHSSALAAPLLHVEADERDTSTPSPIEVTFVSQEELDVQPVPIDPVIPVYPSEASSASAGGLIKLQLVIDEVGRVMSVDVIESALPAAFGVSATRAFETVRFQPGLRNGLPVACRITTSIQFAPTAFVQMTSTPRDAQSALRE